MNLIFSLIKSALLIVIILLPVLGQADSNKVSHDLHWVFTQAWKRSGETKIIEAKRSAISAKLLLIEGFIPESYEIGFGYSDDSFFDDLGKREYEVSVEMPLWKLGQRNVRAIQLYSEKKLLWSEMQVARLRFAESVRQAYWSAVAANLNVTLSKRRLKSSEDIAKDIEKRVKVGDLAPVDNLLTQESVLEAKNEYLESLQEQFEIQQHYESLVGVPPPKKWITEQPMDKELEKHPMLQHLTGRVRLAQAEVQRLRVVQGENLSLEFSISSERENRQEEDARSFGIAFKFPFGESQQINTEITEAVAELTEAERELMLGERELKLDIMFAENSLQTALAAQGLAERQLRISTTRLKLVQAAFDIGEVSLRELLLSRVNSDKAIQDVELRRIKTANSTSNLNQKRGLLPVSIVKE